MSISGHQRHHAENAGVDVAEYWERRYQERDRVWSGRANPVLVDVVEPLPAGTALDLGCGEGADAVWLARHGWRVTAADVSATALERASGHAAGAGVADRIDFQRHDLARTLPDGSFDLVSAQFFQSNVELPRERILRAVAEKVAPGGLLLVVTHATVPPWSWHPHEDAVPTPQEELAALGLALDDWHTERLDAPARRVTGPEGQQATVTDNVIALRRRVR
ncbi:bifunctional 2-polyprenyl-6-hydroxyphenol methylase/3-demethylubiquinol 3-O-methyltransferase UbiG [Streptomyces sp. UNOB3_S3]|uniref:class I SAM-dependent methyltransferase n=1 Tax=Streptomyces sp. UNOB3_S3 TaxID=2871682 RepID=UPI001E48B7B4|nr:class I SAM-dependent methyltransferase [Streptomyces sp. UNOB3_S3]MCC3775823.1 class I SAM-dependent methyltransferase [Streptomyces sp. UNOB3_S3]